MNHAIAVSDYLAEFEGRYVTPNVLNASSVFSCRPLGGRRRKVQYLYRQSTVQASLDCVVAKISTAARHKHSLDGHEGSFAAFCSGKFDRHGDNAPTCSGRQATDIARHFEIGKSA
jgi:hypothetical protein